MEMDPGELGHDGECIIAGISDDHLLSQGSPDTNKIFGDPQVFPRVGGQYQVEIPLLMTESEHLLLMKNPADTEVTVEHSFLMGLPIPILWAHEQLDNIKQESLEFSGNPCSRLNINVMVESERTKEMHVNLNDKDSKVKVEFLDLALDNWKGSGESENGEQTVVMDMDLPSHQHEEPSPDQMYSNKGYSPLPGSIGSSWSNVEVESFILGLYIFGKNLVQVKIFVETKEMGDILSYYYGKFYRSDGYRRWSECRKIRSRKCIHGQRIFTGWRQRELFSRLFSHVSEEGQNTLLEVSKTFGEGKIALEEYVYTLKATVGMNVLIEAVGIGKGKKDLTGIVDPIKTTRPEIPIGQDCNSLSSADIIRFLTGDYRLSKNRANDLFWDAVWPRLLHIGWNSEKPKNRGGYAGSKDSVVFLIPGVKKFSKKKLAKGIHYFDSVTDVLNKVASDPRLLGVEGVTPKSEGNKGENGTSDGRPKCHLPPRSSNCKSDLVKFTVVDTSLVRGEGPSKIRDLRTLPVGITTISPPTSLSRETDTDSSEEAEDEPESADMLWNGHSERGLCTDLSDCLLSDSKQGRSSNDLDNTNNVSMEDQQYQYANDKHSSKTAKRHFSQSIKPCQSKYLTPITKRRRLTAFGHAETSRRAGSQLKEEDPCCHLDSPGVVETMEKVSTDSSAKDSSGDCSEGVLSGVVTALSHRRPLIDLNLPHALQDFETDEPGTTEVADSQDDPITKEESSFPIETSKMEEDSQTLETSNDVVNVEHQSGGRRQSTRNRPLTTKALEALACGFLNTTRKPRAEKALLRENSISRPSRRPRVRGGVKGKLTTDVVANGVVNRMADERVDEECSSNTDNIVINSQIWPETKSSAAYHPELWECKDD